MAQPSNPIYNYLVAITKSDTVNVQAPIPDRVLLNAIYVGGSGDIAVVGEDGRAVTLIGAIAGTIIPVSGKRVNSANTSATDLVALYSV